MPLTRVWSATVVVLSLAVAACAGAPQTQRLAERQAAYAAAAGAPVSSFRFFQPLWSWEDLGTDQVVIYTRPQHAWLLDVPGCNELPFANQLAITSNLDQVSINFDRVFVGHAGYPCTIRQIRPVDMVRLKAVQQQQRQIQVQPRVPGG